MEVKVKMSNDWIEVEDGNENSESGFEGEIWKPELVDEFIIGKYVEMEENVGTENKSTLYHIRTPDDELYKVWGTMVLDTLFQKVELQSEVKLVYKGKKQSKNGRYYKIFKLFHKGGGGASSSSSSTVEKPTQNEENMMDNDAQIMDITREQEHDDQIARGWLERVTNYFVNMGISPNETKLKAEVYNRIGNRDKELGKLDEDMAKKVFKLIEKKG